MAQTSRPVADFAAPTNFFAGSVTFPGPPAPNVADLYETVDEAVASDADGIVLQSSGGTAWFTMDTLSAPSELFLFLRSGGHNSSGVVTTASLYEPDGTTLIDSQMFVPFTDGVLATKTVEFDISGGISDPSALVIKLEQGSTLGSGGYVYTTQLYLYDSGGGGGGTFTVSPTLVEAVGHSWDDPDPKGNGKSSEVIVRTTRNLESTGRMWRIKGETLNGIRQRKICAYCGMYCSGDVAQAYQGKWYCPDHRPRESNIGPNAVNF